MYPYSYFTYVLYVQRSSSLIGWCRQLTCTWSCVILITTSAWLWNPCQRPSITGVRVRWPPRRPRVARVSELSTCYFNTATTITTTTTVKLWFSTNHKSVEIYPRSVSTSREGLVSSFRSVSIRASLPDFKFLSKWREYVLCLAFWHSSNDCLYRRQRASRSIWAGDMWHSIVLLSLLSQAHKRIYLVRRHVVLNCTL